MYPSYSDIRSRLGEPLWNDANGVPRYDEFEPRMLGVYDKFATLFLVQCQSCGQTFPCGMGGRDWYWNGSTMKECASINDFLRDFVSWGDAPRHGGCAGETMSSSVVKLLSVWERNRGDWEKLEITQEMTDLVVEF